VSTADVIREALRNTPRLTALVGTFVGFEGGMPLVDVGGGRIPVATFGGIFPIVNESCHVWFINGSPFLMGPTAPKPGIGTVTAVDGDLVTVQTDAGDVILPFYAGYSPAVDDIVKIDWSSAPAVAWVLSTQPDAEPAPPAPGGGTGESVQVFTAVDAGSHDPAYGWHLADVWASNSKIGAWFYGTKISDTVPASATILSVEMYMAPTKILGVPNLVAHANPVRPAGGLAISSANVPVGIAAGWVGLPIAFGQHLKAGGSSFGVGVNHGGFSKFASLAQDPMSGALRIRYKL
jgi:hypothetical protein